MEIEIDLSKIIEILNLPADQLLLKMILTVGWIPVVIVILWFFKEEWIFYIQGKWGANIKYILLAIDIPRGNAQSPKAVENIFTYMAGAHGTTNLIEDYWEGKFQLSFGFEIVSIDGYTQFLVRTPTDFKNLVETAIYSQYPDAEITEVNDYTEGMPTKFPDDEYDIWGAEFIYVKNQAYPIKVYSEFMHDFGEPEERFKDPMASLMDLCSSLLPGEQMWHQIIIKPIDGSWVDSTEKEVGKILNEQVGTSDHIVDKMISAFANLLESFSETVYSLWGDIEDSKSETKDESLKMMNLKPRDKKRVEAIHEKVAKLGFETKIRYIYLARKEVINKPKGVNGFVGYIKQYNTEDLNALKPDMSVTATSTAYFFKDYRLNQRKNKLIANYVSRSSWGGRLAKVMNIEELATLWHFPVEAVVKAPLIQKAPGRKSEPPNSLPLSPGYGKNDSDAVSKAVMNDVFLDNNKKIKSEEKKIEKASNTEISENIFIEENINNNEDNKNNTPEKAGPPSNLPFV